MRIGPYVLETVRMADNFVRTVRVTVLADGAS